jgi:hypothetical protein
MKMEIPPSNAPSGKKNRGGIEEEAGAQCVVAPA